MNLRKTNVIVDWIVFKDKTKDFGGYLEDVCDYSQRKTFG